MISSATPAPTRAECCLRQQRLTSCAYLVGVGIASGCADTHPSVQKHMVGLILTNHERGIVCHRPVGMVYDSLRWQLSPERMFGSHAV